MRHIIQSNWILPASLALLMGLLSYPLLAAQADKPRTITTISEQAPQAEDWKSLLTAEERNAISKPDKPKDRVKTYIRLAESRLDSARAYLNRDDYTGADEQVKGYLALIVDVGEFAKTSVPKRDKTHKKLEISLREQVRILEGIRRDISSRYSGTVEKALVTANQIRRQALGMLLGEGFLAPPKKP